MKKVQEGILKVVEKVASADVKRGKYGGGPPYCPVIFHQPKRPVKREDN